MDNIVTLEGARLELNVLQGDPSSVSATLIMKEQTSGQIVTITGSYVDGVADVSLDGTQLTGVYDYQINEDFATGAPDKYPDPDSCDGDCELPTITVCESLDGVEVS